MKIQVQIYLPDQNQGTVWGYGTITLDQLLTFQIRILTCEKGAGIKEAFVSFPRRKQGERWEDLVIVEDSLRNQITEAVREVIQMEITKDLYLPPIKVVHLQIFPKGKKKFLVGEATIRVLGVTVKGILLKQGKYGVFCQMPQYYSEKKGYQDVIYSPSKRLRDAIFQTVLETYQERQKGVDMENERGKQEVLMALQGVGRLGIMMDPVFKLTAAGTILLIQHFARMYKEGLLNRREFQNFQEFAKLTEGNYQIVNIPIGSWKELEKAGFVIQMEERGVRYVELPDLNQADGLVQVAIYGEDKLKFQAWYDRFLMAAMKGGEHELRDLNNLTSGRTSIVSIPIEQNVDLLKDDFDVLQVNYSMLPDLNVGDGDIQVVVANADLAKVEHWYRMYQEQCLTDGKEIPDFHTIDMGKYRETGAMDEESYVDTSSKEIQEAVSKYEGQEPGELEQKVLKQEQSIRSMNNEQYQEFHNNPEFIEITINHETLVQESQLASSWDMERRGMFASRIPGTWGDGEQTLVLPTEQVFRTDDGKTYIGFVERKEKQLILNADGSMVPSEKRSTGERLYAERYEPVSRKFGKKESLQKNTAEKEMIQNVIKQAPSKVPTIPKKGI